MKTCTKCGVEKALTEFHRRTKSRDGYRHRCRECSAAYLRAYYQRNREVAKKYARDYYHANLEESREKGRLARLAREYGITPADYQTMLEAQGGVCLICGGTGGMAHMLSPLVVDHTHDETKRIRGLLCAMCNVGLGAFGDDPDRLIAAAAYLLRNADVLGMVE